ncbi:MAG TPA: hypothetical protein DEP18_04560 [Flavobacteriales bacterium]|nr:hypothetical protein [Flavobacteriales bacterium]HRE74879.1 hypothetical protein [Flavobacteriales bacterium]HRJ36868.1 hypothetical protein [Flavobacteriales bacterium]HRJ37897.1 hypothetical protein [Flavobacteriales bacterium]
MSEILDEPIDAPRESSYPRKRYAPVFVFGPVLLLGLFLKTMHWPGGAFIFFIGLSMMLGHALAILIHFQKNTFITNVGSILLSFVVIYKYIYPFHYQTCLLSGGVAFVSAFFCWLYFRD